MGNSFSHQQYSKYKPYLCEKKLVSIMDDDNEDYFYFDDFMEKHRVYLNIRNLENPNSNIDKLFLHKPYWRKYKNKNNPSKYIYKNSKYSPINKDIKNSSGFMVIGRFSQFKDTKVCVKEGFFMDCSSLFNCRINCNSFVLLNSNFNEDDRIYINAPNDDIYINKHYMYINGKTMCTMYSLEKIFFCLNETGLYSEHREHSLFNFPMIVRTDLYLENISKIYSLEKFQKIKNIGLKICIT